MAINGASDISKLAGELVLARAIAQEIHRSRNRIALFFRTHSRLSLWHQQLSFGRNKMTIINWTLNSSALFPQS